MGIKEYVEKKKAKFDVYRAKREQKRMDTQRTRELEAKLKLQAAEADLAERANKAQEKYGRLKRQEQYHATIEKVQKKESELAAKRPIGGKVGAGFTVMGKANDGLDSFERGGGLMGKGSGLDFNIGTSSKGGGLGMTFGSPKKGGDDWGMGDMFGSPNPQHKSKPKKKGKTKYVTYNQLVYKDGKKTRPFRAGEGTSSKSAKRASDSSNRVWNKIMKKKGVQVKRVRIKKVRR